MISEFFLNIIFNFIVSILNRVPFADLVWEVSADKLSPFMSIVQSVLYFFPVGTVATIISVIVIFGILRAVVRLIITIWDLLPLV